jgi:hypothetical protein
MTPQDFIDCLDGWTRNGGPFPRIGPHELTRVAEAQALCRATASPHIYTAGDYGRLALFDLMDFFQASETRESTYHLRDHGLPILRRILTDAFHRESDEDKGARDRRSALLFVVKVLAAYQQRGDAKMIVQAARDVRLADGYLWPTIFGMIAERHPEAVEICDGLSDPLPVGDLVMPYLDFANRLARERRISPHPFATDAGIERLSGFLADGDGDDRGSAISAASSIPFLPDEAREALLAKADAHPQPLVRLEAAWAMARVGSLTGHRNLVAFCRNPRFSSRATTYLEELGLAKLIPPETQRPDFRAMSQMSDWLAHPAEYGRPPDEITQYDTRELYWPPTQRRERLWLFKYRYEPDVDEDLRDGIGLVGPITFSLSTTTPDLSPEDVYGLHCSWELRRGAREMPSAADGRNLIAGLNPGFPRV